MPKLELVLAVLVSAAPPETIERAVDLVAQNVLPVYRSRADPECLSFMAEGEIGEHFDVAIRERHTGKCGGDERTSPIVDRFRVERGSGAILWYDPVAGGYAPFEAFARRRR